jgi:hypothetical protein
MRVLFSTYGSRGDVEPMEVLEECDATVATGVIPTGVWR